MLEVAPCSHEAARYAVLTWHYSRAMPTGKLVKHGVWEQGHYRGAVLYGRGANNRLLQPYGLDATEGCELVRVALSPDHVAQVTEVVARSLRLLRSSNPGLRLVASYADPAQGHRGAIYQAGNWLYMGTSTPQAAMVVNGQRMHKRTVSSLYGTASVERLRAGGLDASWDTATWKHLYLMPLDRQMRRRLTGLARPYPATAVPPST